MATKKILIYLRDIRWRSIYFKYFFADEFLDLVNCTILVVAWWLLTASKKTDCIIFDMSYKCYTVLSVKRNVPTDIKQIWHLGRDNRNSFLTLFLRDLHYLPVDSYPTRCFYYHISPFIRYMSSQITFWFNSIWTISSI